MFELEQKGSRNLFDKVKFQNGFEILNVILRKVTGNAKGPKKLSEIVKIQDNGQSR